MFPLTGIRARGPGQPLQLTDETHGTRFALLKFPSGRGSFAVGVQSTPRRPGRLCGSWHQDSPVDMNRLLGRSNLRGIEGFLCHDLKPYIYIHIF